MVRYEIKKVFSRTGGKLALLLMLLMTVSVSVFAVRSVDFVDADGNSTTGIAAAKLLREKKSAWTGALTEEVFSEVIRENAAVEATPEAQSKDWHENNKAYAKKQGYADIRDIINASLCGFREYDYYRIDQAGEEDAAQVYSRRIANLKDWLASDEAKDRFSKAQKAFFLQKYRELKTPLFYEAADGWDALLTYVQICIMLLMLLLSFLVCSIFVGEYQWKADAVFFASEKGRRAGVRAKIAAGLWIITVFYWCMVLLCTVIVLFFFGTGGWNSPIQASLYGWKSFYNITFFEDYLLTVGGGYVGTLCILSAEILLSVLTRSAVLSISLPFVLLFLPSFFGSLPRFSGLLGLLPDQLLQVGTAVRMFNAYEFGGTVWGALPLLFAGYTLLFLTMLPAIYGIYRRAR